MRHKTSERQEASLKLILPLSWALSFYEKNAKVICHVIVEEIHPFENFYLVPRLAPVSQVQNFHDEPYT